MKEKEVVVKMTNKDGKVWYKRVFKSGNTPTNFSMSK